ncbi:MAG: transposase [Bacteroidota bacterium]
MKLTNGQWEAIQDFFLAPEPGKVGRPRQDIRSVINGILWICRTGAKWRSLPSIYPPYQTCHRYFQQWNSEGLWDQILYALAQDLKARGKIDIEECFIDGITRARIFGDFYEFWSDPTRGPIVRADSLYDFTSTPPVEINERLAKYLKSGLLIAGMRSLDEDPFDEESMIKGGGSFYTDGNWVWTGFIIHYYPMGKIALPRNFVEDIEQQDYQMPEFTYEDKIKFGNELGYLF